MYCHTQINNLTCVFSELQLWCDISGEHPIFIKTVGDLTNKKLPQSVLEKLININKIFITLRNETLEIKNSMVITPQMHNKYVGQLRRLVNEFLRNDEYFLEILPEIKQYGKNDKVWQTLLDHIIHEQKFMYDLFTDLKGQLK